MNKSEFADLFEALNSAFSKEVNQKQANIYYSMFMDVPVEQFEEAVSSAIRGCEYFPSIAKLTEIISPIDTGKSWDKIMSVARKGCRNWDILTDTEIATIQEIGGIGQIQNSDDNGVRYIFNKFEKVFPVMAKRRINFGTDVIRLKSLGMHYETFNFIKNTEKGRKLLGE